MLNRRDLMRSTLAAGAVAGVTAAGRSATGATLAPPAPPPPSELVKTRIKPARRGGTGGPTPADYDRALNLRDAWTYLTVDLPDAAGWVEKTGRLVYRKTVKGGFAFMAVDAASLAKTPAFDHERMAKALSLATGETYTAARLPFRSIRFSEDGAFLEMSVEEAPWRCRLSDYHCETAPRLRRPRGFGVVRDLTVPAHNTPHVSPDGRWEALVENHNLVVRPAGAATLTALTALRVLSTDGSDGDFYDPETIAWSPDSKTIAIYRVRPGFPRLVTRVESSPADQVQPRLRTQLYPKPGDAVDVEKPVLFRLDSGRQLTLDDALMPNPYAMSPFIWRKDSATVSFDYDQRGHQLYRVIEADAATGTVRAVITETQKTFVNIERLYRHDVRGAGDEVIWMSERDGWNHLYLIDGPTGRVKTQITQGAWVVRKVLKVDDAKRRIWFAASGMYPGQDPYFLHAYGVDFDGGNLTALTHIDASHDVAISPDGALYADTYSRVDLPPVLELRRTADQSLVAVLEKADVSALMAAGYRVPEPFVAKGRDGVTDIWGLIVKPLNHDPARKYPVIENIYAGPHDSFVPKTFWPFGAFGGGDKVVGMQANAEMGFIVVQIDGMGTMNRSKAFHDVCWKNIADAGFPDRIAWHKALAAKDPSYDISRVGIYGGSAGAQNAMAALLFHGDFYHAAVAYAGCHDNRMDKISWNEQWMGWPVDESYSRSSNVDNAWRLKGQLSLIVGEQDSNVDPSSTLQVVNALIKHDKIFELLIVPGAEHAAGRSVGPVKYASRRQYDFFIRCLQGRDPPDWNGSARPVMVDA
jgi:dipeptidyl aminopeptidase/acylaminoacyl peptidase